MPLREGKASLDADRALPALKFMTNSKEAIILTDNSKLGNSRLYKIADLGEVNTAISEQLYPAEWSSAMDKHQLEWIVAE